mmetsp:Transcript_73448/g.146097  ORF Transcript_73448/g.146097 Transcript_73448/m.146097 type:complete len:217 (-) Transcript_73448:762-1412(-)
MVCDEPLAVGEGRAGLFHHADGQAVDGIVDLVVGDLSLAVTRRDDGRLVHQVGKARARKSRRALGDNFQLHGVGDRLAAAVHLEDCLAAVVVGQIDGHTAIETARPEQGIIQDVGTVGRRKDDDARVALEAVHLSQDLVERLLALVVTASTAARASSTLATDGVDLVNEDDARRVLFSLTEEVAHACGADANEHLDELGARGRHERHASLAGDGTR